LDCRLSPNADCLRHDFRLVLLELDLISLIGSSLGSMALLLRNFTLDKEEFRMGLPSMLRMDRAFRVCSSEITLVESTSLST